MESMEKAPHKLKPVGGTVAMAIAMIFLVNISPSKAVNFSPDGKISDTNDNHATMNKNDNYATTNMSMGDSQGEGLEFLMDSHVSRMLADSAGCGTAVAQDNKKVFNCGKGIKQYKPCYPCPTGSVPEHCGIYNKGCEH